MKEYTIDNADNIYNVFISCIMKCLVDRGLLKEIKQRSGNTELNAYESTDLLKEKCAEFMKYLIGDIDRF